jgi:hypothetical protein
MDAYPTASGGGVKFFYRGLCTVQEHPALQIVLILLYTKPVFLNQMRKVIILSLFLASCSQSENKIQSKIYYDLAGLINQQISDLSAKKYLIEKTVTLGEKKEQIKTKDIDWHKELELFLQADLNKQSYQSAYTIDVKDKKTTYLLKEGEKLPVKQLIVEFDQKDLPKHIEVTMHTNNYLYESDKKLSADLENNLFKTYRIEGYQELFVGSKKNFSIEGKIK